MVRGVESRALAARPSAESRKKASGRKKRKSR
jgi:hypothetical protein